VGNCRRVKPDGGVCPDWGKCRGLDSVVRRTSKITR
jgi:hypothetical protein